MCFSVHSCKIPLAATSFFLIYNTPPFLLHSYVTINIAYIHCRQFHVAPLQPTLLGLSVFFLSFLIDPSQASYFSHTAVYVQKEKNKSPGTKNDSEAKCLRLIYTRYFAEGAAGRALIGSSYFNFIVKMRNKKQFLSLSR